MQIINSNIGDLDTIFNLYEEAIAYQKTKFDKHWLSFDRGMVETEIKENRQWKIMDGENVLGIFAIAYEDPFIWQEKNADPAIYIHRIVTSPLHRGKQLVKRIIEWAQVHAKSTNKEYIRMDTWGDNEALIKYYSKCGFNFLGTITPESSADLPEHYSAIFLSLFEIKIN